MRNKILTAVLGISIFFLIITAAIGLPIYFRFFYYIHIKALNLEKTGFTYAEIKQAYDQVLNFLTLPFTTFGTGVMKHSEEGAAHFADCKALFTLNSVVLFLSAVSCITIGILNKKKYIKLCRPCGFSVSFFSAVTAIVLPVIIGGIAATDFDKAFVVFHHIFFPGKSNWIFSERYDEIIKVLPQQFFMNCAILIGAGLIVICAAIIVSEIIKRKKRKKIK